MQRASFFGLENCPTNTSYFHYGGDYCKGQSALFKGKSATSHTHSIVNQIDCLPNTSNEIVKWKGLYNKDGSPDTKSCTMEGKKYEWYKNHDKKLGALQCGSCYRYSGSGHTFNCK